MNLLKLYNKLFTGGQWVVGVRDKTDKSTIYKSIKVNNGQWLADPFLYESNGRHFLFVEQYFNDKNKAALGVYEIVEGIPTNNNVIIDNPYHMSYPFVFCYKGAHYMIPESSSNHTLDLYKAIEFPSKWEHEVTLVKNKRLVDTTVFVKEDDVYLLTYESLSSGWALNIFVLDMNDYSLFKIGETNYNKNVGRPAGGLFVKDCRLFRPAQNCQNKYGESLYIYEVLDISKSSYIEKFAYEIKCSDINFDGKFDRIHTLNADSRYEVIDVFQEQFDFLHWWKIAKRHFLKK